MIRVRNIMTKEVVTVPQKSSIIEAAKLITSKSVSSLVVVENNKPIGVISEGDIINGVISKKSNIKDIMSKDFMIVPPSTQFSKISKLLREKKMKRFPVVENEKLLGIITETDIVEATRDFTRFHQIMQEIILAIFGLATAFFLFYFSPLGTTIFR